MTGTIWTAIAHIITGVIGAGVLSLAWSTAQLGWVAGPLAIVLFAAITQISIFLVCDCYRSPDPACGPTRNRSFIDAVKFYLGQLFSLFTGVVFFFFFFFFIIDFLCDVVDFLISVKIIEKVTAIEKIRECMFQGKRSKESAQYSCWRASTDVESHIQS